MATTFLIFNKTTEPVTLAIGEIVLPPSSVEDGIGDIVDVTNILANLTRDQQALVRKQILANQIGLILPVAISPVIIKSIDTVGEAPISTASSFANPKGISLETVTAAWVASPMINGKSILMPIAVPVET